MYLSGLSGEELMGRASVIYGLNPYLLTLSNPVGLYDGLGTSPGFHTIETCNELFFDPPALTGWQRFWRSETGRTLAVGLLTFGLVLSLICPKLGLVLGVSLGLAGVSLVAGGLSAGRRSRDRGGEFWEGFVNHVSGAWAQSVSLSVTVSLVSFGLAKGIGAVAVKKAGSKKQLASAALNDGLGTYASQKGHHPMIAEAFRGLSNYSFDNALTISLAKLGTFVNILDGLALHAKITGKQKSLYKGKFMKGQIMTLDDMVQIEIDAMIMVGVPSDYATHAVNKAMAQLKSWGVQPIKIPWVK